MRTKHHKPFIRHDVDASRDTKIQELRLDHGILGYGVYWALIEYLFEQGGKAKYDFRFLAHVLNVDARTLRKILPDCIEKYHLFDEEDSYFWSNRLNRELDNIKGTSMQNSINVSKRYATESDNNLQVKDLQNSDKDLKTYDRSTTVVQPYNERTTIKEVDEEKNKIQVEKETYGEFQNVLLSKAEYLRLLNEEGIEEATKWIEELSCYKESKGKKYKSDYATIRNWVRTKNKEIVQTHSTSNFEGGGKVLPFKPKPLKPFFEEEEAQA